MAEHGGYRRPANPAPVSGPGALSQRTDGGPGSMEVTGLPYGQNQALNDVMGSAAMGGLPAVSAPSGGSAPPPQMPLGLGAPSERPGEPVTAGAAAGPGASPQDIGLSQSRAQEVKAALGPYAPVLMRMADSPTATPSYRRQVRQYLAMINS